MPPSPARAFAELALFTFRRQWRVRQMGWSALGLLLLLAAVVAAVSRGPAGWEFRTRRTFIADRKPDASVRMTTEQYAAERMPMYLALPGPPGSAGVTAAAFAPLWAILADAEYQRELAFLNFSRWVVFGMFLTFLLPLFTLAFASAGIGGEREGRTLLWLVTRPLPREAVYLANFLGTLPWCLLASVGGLAVLALAGGDLGRRAFAAYWPAAVGGAAAFSALFHLVGALFRRPAVVGLVYIFFFETLVANLPGSLKQLSLNYYVRSLLYSEATGRVERAAPVNLDVYAPAGPTTAWAALAAVAVTLVAVGMLVFRRQEAADDV